MPISKPSAEVIRNALQHIAIFVHGKRIEKKTWEEIKIIVAEVEKLEWRRMTPSQRRRAHELGWFQYLPRPKYQKNQLDGR